MKIIQILIGPDNSRYQGALLGLGDDGSIYETSNGERGNIWKPYFEICQRCDNGRGIFQAWSQLKGSHNAFCTCPAGKIEMDKAESKP